MTLREVSPSEVLAIALSLVRSARTEILATMDLGEELAQPLPEEYFLLLKQKMQTGVHVIREGFGTASECASFLLMRSITSPYYQFIPVHDFPYRRMLMVDRQKMLFVKQQKKKKVIYYSEDSEVIKIYLTYFQQIKQRVHRETSSGAPTTRR